MITLFNPILTKKVEKRLIKYYRLKRIKKESKKSYFKWRKEINNNNDLFECLYFVACQEEAHLIELYDRHIGNDDVIAENLNGEIIGGDSFNKVYDTLDGDYYHYRDKEALILVNTCSKSNKWHFYKKSDDRADRIEIFHVETEIISDPVENEIIERDNSENIESNDDKDNKSEENENVSEENSDC